MNKKYQVIGQMRIFADMDKTGIINKGECGMHISTFLCATYRLFEDMLSKYPHCEELDDALNLIKKNNVKELCENKELLNMCVSFIKECHEYNDLNIHVYLVRYPASYPDNTAILKIKFIDLLPPEQTVYLNISNYKEIGFDYFIDTAVITFMSDN